MKTQTQVYKTTNQNQSAETRSIHQVCVDYAQRCHFTKEPINDKHSTRPFFAYIVSSQCDRLITDLLMSGLAVIAGLLPDVSSMSMNWMSSVKSCSSGWLFLSPLTLSMFDRGKEICLSTAASVGQADLDTKATRLGPDGVKQEECPHQ